MNMPQPKPEDPLPYYQRVLPRWMVLRWLRFQFVLVPLIVYLLCQTFPNMMRKFLRSEAKKALPEDFNMDPSLQPKYNPWDQRLCFVPDNDFFKAFHTGKARYVSPGYKVAVFCKYGCPKCSDNRTS